MEDTSAIKLVPFVKLIMQFFTQLHANQYNSPYVLGVGLN